MDPVPTAPYVVPNPRIPKVLGILNIVFASGLLICGLCSIAYYSLIPVFSETMVKAQNEMQERRVAERKHILEELEAQEQAAESDADKAEIREARKQFETEQAKIKPVAFDFGTMGLEGGKVRTYVWVEFLSGFVLNLLLMTAGIGLVMGKLWGLRLGMTVAALKILRLVLVYGYAALVVVPDISPKMAKFQIQQMEMVTQQQGAKPLPPTFTVEYMTRFIAVWFTMCAVGMIVIGMIYPTISLWLLSRPSARAACSGQPEATSDKNGPGPGLAESW